MILPERPIASARVVTAGRPAYRDPMPVSPPGPDAASRHDARFLRACRGEPTDTTPVWFMRQAGRSLPEYHEVRGPGSILDAIADPDRAVEITLQPVRRHGVDAAILYSDIVVPAAAIGFGVTVEPGIGPVIAEPFSSQRDLERFRPLDPGDDTPYVLETVRRLVEQLDVPLIGFAGAPFTVASYLCEGGPSKSQGRTKALMLGEPELFGALLDRLADLAITSIASQVAAGASAAQLFDSWAGALSVDHYRRYVLPHSRKVFDALRDLDVPTVHFGVGTGELLASMADAGPDVVGVDWRVDLGQARSRVGERAVQGNLDPAACLAPWPVVEAEVRRILATNGGRPGHVFNLGHGVLPETDPTVLTRVVQLVHDHGRTAAAAPEGS